jgi:hypothetical protein
MFVFVVWSLGLFGIWNLAFGIYLVPRFAGLVLGIWNFHLGGFKDGFHG